MPSAVYLANRLKSLALAGNQTVEEIIFAEINNEMDKFFAITSRKNQEVIITAWVLVRKKKLRDKSKEFWTQTYTYQ